MLQDLVDQPGLWHDVATEVALRELQDLMDQPDLVRNVATEVTLRELQGLGHPRSVGSKSVLGARGRSKTWAPPSGCCVPCHSHWAAGLQGAH